MATVGHARLAPSSAARWAGQCAGSVDLESAFPDMDDPAHDQKRAEGHAAHWVAASALYAGFPVEQLYASGFPAPNGIVVDDEMLEAVAMYVDHVRATLPEIANHVEEWVSINRIHRENGGTPDNWKFRRRIIESPLEDRHKVGGTLHIWDFKYGHGFIDAFENWQLIDYLAGILDHPELAGVDHAYLEIIFHVVQPRNYAPIGPIREWRTTVEELEPFFALLRIGAEGAVSDKPWLRVGPMCADCKGRHACKALHTASDEIADLVYGTVPLELPPDALGIELRMLQRAAELLDARITGLEAAGMAYVRAGKTVPFFQIEQNLGKESWTMTPDEIFALGDAMGVDLRKPTPITPFQARKAGMSDDLVKSLAGRQPGPMKFKPANTTQARKVFGNG